MSDLPDRSAAEPDDRALTADPGGPRGSDGWGPLPAGYGSLSAARPVAGRERSGSGPSEDRWAVPSLLKRLQNQSPGDASGSASAAGSASGSTAAEPVTLRAAAGSAAADPELYSGTERGGRSSEVWAPGRRDRTDGGAVGRRRPRPVPDDLPSGADEGAPEGLAAPVARRGDRTRRPGRLEPLADRGPVEDAPGSPVGSPSRDPLAGEDDHDYADRPPPRRRPLARRRAGRAVRVRARATVRHLNVWSVFKVSIVFYLVVLAAFVVASVLLLMAADAFGTLPSLEKSIRTLFSLKTFKLHVGQVATYTAAVGVVIAIAGTLANVLMALIYNLISDMVGGVRIDLESVTRE